MDVKRRTKQVFGGLVILVGCAFASPLLLTLVSGRNYNLRTNDGMPVYLVRLGALILFTSLSAYLICTGLRMVSPKVLRPFRFGWGKILLGSWMLFSEASSHYHLAPEGPLPILKPSNATEAVSMKVTGIAMCLVSVYLIFRGIRAVFTHVSRCQHPASPRRRRSSWQVPQPAPHSTIGKYFHRVRKSPYLQINNLPS
jgi:hypothetical protein